MKKITLLLLLFIAWNPDTLKAQNPIPSWNVPVYYRADFSETTRGLANFIQKSRGKRVLHVDARPATTTPTPSGTLWVYCTETQTVIGPISIYAGQTLTFDIDDYDWGVLVESDNHLVVDVWIE